MTVAVGDAAPDITLKDQHGQTYRLADRRGSRPVLLVFFPWAFSGTCGGELQALRDRHAELVEDVEVVTVSTDSMYALRAWGDQEGFPFPMLADFWPHGEVARAYGVLHEEIGIALRGSFLVGLDGVVRWCVRQGIPDARDVDDYVKAVAAL